MTNTIDPEEIVAIALDECPNHMAYAVGYAIRENGIHMDDVRVLFEARGVLFSAPGNQGLRDAGWHHVGSDVGTRPLVHEETGLVLNDPADIAEVMHEIEVRDVACLRADMADCGRFDR